MLFLHLSHKYVYLNYANAHLFSQHLESCIYILDTQVMMKVYVIPLSDQNG